MARATGQRGCHGHHGRRRREPKPKPQFPPHTWFLRARVAFPVVWIFTSMCAAAQTRDASAYPAHLTLSERTLAVEYLARSIPVAGGSLFTEDYLVIDVAFFGPKYDSLAVSASNRTW